MGSVNIMGETDTLKVLKGEDVIKRYQAIKYDKGKPSGKCNSFRSFCGECSTMLWLHDDEWQKWIYPFASAIDTDLMDLTRQIAAKRGSDDTPLDPPTLTVIMTSSAPDYLPVPEGSMCYKNYAPGEGIEAWHKKHDLWVD